MKEEWPDTMDAELWAKEFNKTFPGKMDQDTMLGWFANAIMRGYDKGYVNGVGESKQRPALSVGTPEIYEQHKIRKEAHMPAIKSIKKTPAKKSPKKTTKKAAPKKNPTTKSH